MLTEFYAPNNSAINSIDCRGKGRPLTPLMMPLQAVFKCASLKFFYNPFTIVEVSNFVNKVKIRY